MNISGRLNRLQKKQRFFYFCKMNVNELDLLRERYLKLVDIHGEIQKQNSLLEERILSIVESYSDEKTHLENELSRAKEQIQYLQHTVEELQIDKQRYKDDCNLAVRLLHQHPKEFITTTSGQLQEQVVKTNLTQRSILMPTFPPIFVPPPQLITTTTVTNELNTNENLRLAETLFKSNSVNRSTTTSVVCSNCSRTIKRCDVSVQTSLDKSNKFNLTSRLRLISSTSDEETTNENDGAWISLDSPHERKVTNEFYPINSTKSIIPENKFSTSNIPGVYDV